MNSMLRLAAAAIAVGFLSPVLAQTPDASLQQPDITVVGFDCCEPTCGCDDACCDPSCGCAAGECCDGGCCNNGCCGRECCVATVERVKVEKHCWCTETKKVCVPKVVCPWADGGSGLTLFSFLRKRGGACCGDACGCGDGCCESGCCGNDCCGNGCGCLKPRCGKVICVNDLVKKKYECEECVCKWEVRRLPPCCDCCGAGCPDCCGGACCDCVE